MYWIVFIGFVIIFLSMVYKFYPKISDFIKGRIQSYNVVELKGKMQEIDEINEKKQEEKNIKPVKEIISTINSYMNMPYEFVKKMIYLYITPIFYKSVDPFAKTI